MFNKISKLIRRIKFNKKNENIIVLSFFAIAMIAGIIINVNYRTIEVLDTEDKLKIAFELSSNNIINNEKNIMYGINTVCHFISNDCKDDNFYEYVDLEKDNFKYCDYVGILKNGVLVKDYYPNGAFSISTSELGLSFYKLESYTNECEEDVCYFADSSNDVCMLIEKPIYFTVDNTIQYYGEFIARVNVTKLATNFYALEKYGFDGNSPYKIEFEFENGTCLNIGTYNSSKIIYPISIEIEIDGTKYIYTTSNSVLYSTLESNKIRFIFYFMVVLIVTIGLKFLFATVRKQIHMGEMNDKKLDFFTNIVYEVRTSTNSIVGFCNEAEKEQLSLNAKGYINNSKLELKKLLHKIDNILDITNLSEGKQNLYEEEYYIHILVQEIVDEYKMQIEENDLKLLVDISNTLPIKLLGQKAVIKKAICHLIESSLSSIIDGHIKISIYGNYTSQNRKNINLKIIITDTGIGVKDETVKDVFLANTIKDNASDDTKVEMAIASELCKSIGGKLKINSDFGKGTVCTIEINQKVIDDRMMTDEMLTGLKEKYRKNLGKLQKVHANILIVDDNDVNLSVLRNIIKAYGAEVDSAKSGAVAVELALVKNYDMVFIDYLMPEIDGYETLKRIRNINKKYRQIPAVLVSANTFNEEAEFKDAGFDDYLQKPIVQRDIERVLKSLLNLELIECDTFTEE